MRAVIALSLILATRALTADVEWDGEPGFSIAITTSPPSVTVKDIVKIQVTVSKPKGYTVDKEQMRRNLTNFIGFGPDPFSLLSEEKGSAEGGAEVITYSLNPTVAGEHMMTLGPVTFLPEKSDTDKPVTLMTGVFTLPVTLNPALSSADTQYAALLPLSAELPVDITPENQARYLKNRELLEREKQKYRHSLSSNADSNAGFAIILAIKIIIILLAFTRAATRKPGLIPKQLLLRRAHHQALEDLQDLYHQHLKTGQRYDLYYNRLADAVRTFLEKAYNLHAPTMTTQEFIEHIANTPFLSNHEQQALSNFLRLADKVKFAKKQPTKEQCYEAYASARDVITKVLPYDQGMSPLNVSLYRSYFKKYIIG